MSKKKPFHNPFLGLRLEPVAKAKEPARPTPSAPAEAAPQRPTAPDADELLFLQAVGPVQPLRDTKGRVAPDQAARRPPVRVVEDDEEAFAELCELVAGTAPFDLTDSDEFIEGAVSSLDKRILKRLRRGDYAIQGHLDLHGLLREEAKAELIRFVESSRQQGKRCVLVIHGRGLHSKDRIPVLKEGIQTWLTRGRLGSQVLAFATARPEDGGAGAVYVLLRRR